MEIESFARRNDILECLLMLDLGFWYEALPSGKAITVVKKESVAYVFI
jgi:hypothetical protein